MSVEQMTDWPADRLTNDTQHKLELEMDESTRRRTAVVSSMDANNNNNNSYGNDHLNELRQRQVAGERVAVSEKRLATDTTTSGDKPPTQKEATTTTATRWTGSMVRGTEEMAKHRGVENDSRPIASVLIHHWTSVGQHHHHHQRSKASLFVTILLPFVLVFLLPSSTDREFITLDCSHHHHHLTTTQRLDQLLWSLLRLPLDRFRLSSGYSMMMLANAKEISARQVTSTSQDLQEEETHMLVMAPEQQQQVQRQQATGYQLGPVRQAASPYGGVGASAGEQLDSYGHDYATSNPAASHASLINGASTDEDSGPEVMPASASGSVVAPSGGQAAGQQTRTDLPSVRALNVKCEKNHMTVNIVFDRPFYGMVFSKGHYNDQKCVHLPPNSGQTSINFDIHLGKCGMSSSGDSVALTTNGQQQQALQAGGGQQQPNGLFIENTIIIQYDPQVQEIYDQARRLRCTWYDYYEKSVSFRPYNVDMLDAVTANFLGDNIQCWMQIQVGKGPWSSEVAGIVKIGQTMTMVLAIKDEENKFDMLVRNCVASDGKHQPIQLVDEYGCVARPKIMAKFQKVRNFNSAATVVSYAHFQAFKFPDSMSVHFQCVIQVCRTECPEPICGSTSGGSADSIAAAAAAPGGGGIAGPATSSQDYAASGTELVSSKEPLPLSAHPIGLNRANLSHGNSVNLNLDETQGRVQVKLDTSMMANTVAANGHHGLRAGGPLPPHLLHSSSSQQLPTTEQATPVGRGGAHTYLSSSYYRPSLGSASAPAALASRPSVAATSSQMRPIQVTALPVGGQQQYSNPAAASSLIHHHPRPAYMMTNRMGELVSEDGVTGGEDDMTKLSLIASPRALPYAMPTLANHRYRRSINATNHLLSDKHRRHIPSQQAGDSTAIKTQRTIQVVSPDDVAFNLVDLDSGSFGPGSWPAVVQGGDRRRTKAQQYQWSMDNNNNNDDDSMTMVCFSAAKLIASALASLAFLVTLVLAAGWIIVRQRKRLDEKLSPVYDSSSSSSLASPDLIISDQSLMNHHMQQQQRQRAAAAAQEMIMRRQREEMQQRNTYLGRLYSQFVPAAYWR